MCSQSPCAGSEFTWQCLRDLIQAAAWYTDYHGMAPGGAAGLTLTAANTVFIMEPSLNPGLEAQAAGRVHRLGGLADSAVFLAHDCML